jgi:hypothetical protein
LDQSIVNQQTTVKELTHVAAVMRIKQTTATVLTVLIDGKQNSGQMSGNNGDDEDEDELRMTNEGSEAGREEQERNK